ncbi:MAG: ATP-binding protein, partial [Cyanobacteria bacterium P01_D01_bin.73]
NAIDALEENKVTNPCIEIEMTADGDNVTVAITNNGPAIAESAKNRLFDPFFTTKPPGKGTGLGLSISYQIVVDRHGGELRCESVPEDTTFHIVIPIARNIAASDPSAKSPMSVRYKDRQDVPETAHSSEDETTTALSA